MENVQTKIAERIRDGYVEQRKTKVHELMELHKKVKSPAEIFAYVFGTLGALVLGTGMCLAMKVIGDMMIAGVIIGAVGIAMVSANYFLYQKILKRRKAKYAPQILALSDEILNK